MATPVTIKVALVENVRAHPGADRLDLCDVLGWQMAVPKNAFVNGTKVVYFPPDTILPDEWIEKFGVRNYLKGPAQNRVGKIRLRGEPSFGLAVAIPDGQNWSVGENVADYFGAVKYEPPIRAKCEDAEHEHPFFPCYTDVENMRNYPDLFEMGEEVVATEKVHGTNCRVGLIQGEEMAGSMTTRRKAPTTEEDWKRSLYWSPFLVSGVRELLNAVAKEFDSKQVVLFGEVYGRGVQKLSYGIEKGRGFGFAAFDLYVNGKWIDHDEFTAICSRFGVEIAPVLYRGPFSLAAIKNVSDGASVLANGLHVREGVVVRPIHERMCPQLGRLILKYVGDNYLLGNYDDYKDV